MERSSSALRPSTSNGALGARSAPNRTPKRKGKGHQIKVTVIATGFDHAEDEIPVEVSQARVVSSSPAAARRDAFRDNLREGFGTVSAQRAPMSTVRPQEREAAAPAAAASTRRPAALAASLQASSSPMSSAMPEVRSRITFPSGLDETDWDTPAFQRRGGG